MQPLINYQGEYLTLGGYYLRQAEEKEREKLWGDYAKAAGEKQAELGQQVRNLFENQRKGILRRIREEKSLKISPEQVDVWLFDPVTEIALMAETTGPVVKVTVVAFGRRMADQLGIDFDDSAGAVVEYVENRPFEYSTLVTNNSYRDLREELMEGIRNNETTREIADRVNRTYEGWEQYRVERIARTETTAASNFGNLEAMDQSGKVKGKQWLSMRDADVRDSHMAMDRQTVGVHESFSNGLRHPGDPNGSAAEILNCRCTMTPVLMGE